MSLSCNDACEPAQPALQPNRASSCRTGGVNGLNSATLDTSLTIPSIIRSLAAISVVPTFPWTLWVMERRS